MPLHFLLLQNRYFIRKFKKLVKQTGGGNRSEIEVKILQVYSAQPHLMPKVYGDSSLGVKDRGKSCIYLVLTEFQLSNIEQANSIDEGNPV